MNERKGGPVIVKIDEKLGLTKEKYRTMVILRSDGTTLYLAQTIWRWQNRNSKSITLTARSTWWIFARACTSSRYSRSWNCGAFRRQQSVITCHMAMSHCQMEPCLHGAGRVALFKEVYDEAIKRVLAVESERSGNVPEDERVKIAEQIGLGALVYSMLSVDNNKDIVFDINEALSFDGRTGPYIQNAHVRANSILKKSKVERSTVRRSTFDV